MSHSISEQLRFSPAAGFAIQAAFNESEPAANFVPLLLREVGRKSG